MINILKLIILSLISLLEKIEYRTLNLNQDDINKKIISTLDLTDTYIDTDTGWESISSVHITQPYRKWKIILSNGLSLECADDHRVFDENYNEVFVKDLSIGSQVITDEGVVEVGSITMSNVSVSMFDVSVDSENHRYYSNGILSHNTICSSIFIAWYSVFNFDKNSLILSNKGATTREIIDKGKTILEHLPFFIKNGKLK